MKVKCVTCNKEFEARDCGCKTKIACSIQCYRKYRHKNKYIPISGKKRDSSGCYTTTCEYCGAEVRSRSTATRFCPVDTDCSRKRKAEQARRIKRLRANGEMPEAEHRDASNDYAPYKFVRFGLKMKEIQRATPEQMIDIITNYYR